MWRFRLFLLFFGLRILHILWTEFRVEKPLLGGPPQPFVPWGGLGRFRQDVHLVYAADETDLVLCAVPFDKVGVVLKGGKGDKLIFAAGGYWTFETPVASVDMGRGGRVCLADGGVEA